MSQDPLLEVVDDTAAGRVGLRVDGSEVGHLTYQVQGGVITIWHTEIDPAREGQGLGSALVAEVLARAAAAELAVSPVCPFVAAYIRRHPGCARTV